MDGTQEALALVEKWNAEQLQAIRANHLAKKARALQKQDAIRNDPAIQDLNRLYDSVAACEKMDTILKHYKVSSMQDMPIP